MNILLEIIKELECLLWAVVILFFLFMTLKHFVLPIVHLRHEKEMKEEAFGREKQMRGLTGLKACTDEGLNNQVKDLKTKVSEQEGKLKTEEFNRDLLEKQLKMYQNIFEKLNVEVKPKDKK